MRITKNIRTGNVYYPFFFCLLICAVLVGCSSQQNRKMTRWEGEAFGTTYHITFNDDEILVTQAQVDSVIDEVNSVFSTYQPETYINHFNQNTLVSYGRKNETVYQRRNKEFFSVYQLSRKINYNTEGAFDPSAGPLFNLWGFGEQDEHINPSIELIDSTLSFVGMQHFIRIHSDIFKSNESSCLNFNAIAKGHGVDRVALYLEFKGVSDYMVEIGGEVRCKGLNAKNNDWTIGINQPNEGSAANSIYGVVSLSDKALATSGNYRNFYKDSLGNVIGHTINPKTGRPVISDISSASVMAPTCAEADGYATAFMVLGKEKSIEVLAKDTTLSAVFIYKDNGILTDTAVGEISFLK